MKMTPLHVVALVLFAVGTALHFLQLNPQLAAVMHVTAPVIQAVGLIVALTSTALFGTPTPPDPKLVEKSKEVSK